MSGTAPMLASARSRALAIAPKRYAEAGARPHEAESSVAGPKPLATDIDFTLVNTRAGLESLEAEWNALFDRAARDIHVFQSFNWAWHWANHFLRPSDPDSETEMFILTARRAGRLVMIWPMQRRKRGGFAHISFLGEPVSQYGDLLIDDLPDRAEIAEHAWTYLLAHARADVLAFRKVRRDSNFTQLLGGSGAIVTNRQIAPYLDLASAPDFNTYEQRYSNKARKNRNRQLRRFEERGPSSQQSLDGGPRAAELADLAISLKRAWLKDRGLYSSALKDSATREFFIDVALADTRPVGAVVTSLETCGESAAIEIAFDCKGRRAVHIIVFSLKYERASAGQLLIERSIRNAFDKGLTTYDLLAPGDAYKLDWADEFTDVYDYAFGLTIKGRLFAEFYIVRARPRIKAAINGATGLLRRLSRTRQPAQTK